MIRNIVLDHYYNFSLRVSSLLIAPGWNCLENGLTSVCAISIISFALAMNTVGRSAEIVCKGQSLVYSNLQSGPT